MKRQRGVTLGGMIGFMLLLMLLAYSAFRVIPAYLDYWLVERELDELVARSDLHALGEEGIRDLFAKQLKMNNITLVKRSDLLIEQVPGGVRLTATFSSTQRFIGPVSLCLNFQAEASSAQ